MSEWKQMVDTRTGRLYYANTRTKETTWSRPAGFEAHAPPPPPPLPPPEPAPPVPPVASSVPSGAPAVPPVPLKKKPLRIPPTEKAPPVPPVPKAVKKTTAQTRRKASLTPPPPKAPPRKSVISDLDIAPDHMKQLIDELKAETDAKISHLQKEVHLKDSQLFKAETKQAALLKLNMELKLEKQSLSSELGATKQQVKTLNAQLEEQRERTLKAESVGAKAASAEVSKTKFELKKMEERAFKAEAEVARLQHSETKCKMEIRSLRLSNNELADEIKTLESRVQDLLADKGKRIDSNIKQQYVPPPPPEDDKDEPVRLKPALKSALKSKARPTHAKEPAVKEESDKASSQFAEARRRLFGAAPAVNAATPALQKKPAKSALKIPKRTERASSDSKMPAAEAALSPLQRLKLKPSAIEKEETIQESSLKFVEPVKKGLGAISEDGQASKETPPPAFESAMKAMEKRKKDAHHSRSKTQEVFSRLPGTGTALNWTEHVDPKTSMTYYYNKVTRETMWTKPAGFDKPAPPPPVPDDDALPPGWTAHTDPGSGQTYYYNQKQSKTTWVKPGI